MSAACDILYCHCAYARVVPPAVKADVLARLTAANVSFQAVPDLCEMSARRDPRLRELAARAAKSATSDDAGGSGAGAEGARPLAIAACYPRAVRWLFAAADTPLPEQNVTILNMRTDTAESIAHALLDDVVANGTTAAASNASLAESTPATAPAMQKGGA